MEFRINLVVLASSFAVSVLTGILFGLIPALHSSRVDLSQTLKDAGRGSSGGVSGRWTRNALTVSAIAFSMILLVGAGLMIRTFDALTQDTDGVQADQVLTMCYRRLTRRRRTSRTGTLCIRMSWNNSNPRPA